MRKVSYTQMRAELSDILDAIRNGETVVVTQRGRPDTVISGHVGDVLESKTEVKTSNSHEITLDELSSEAQAKTLEKISGWPKGLPTLPKELQAINDFAKRVSEGLPNYSPELKRLQDLIPVNLASKEFQALSANLQKVVSLNKLDEYVKSTNLDAFNKLQGELLRNQNESLDLMRKQIEATKVLSNEHFKSALKLTQFKHAKIIKALEDK